METKEFLDRVLPSAGRRCIGVLVKGERGMRHRFLQDNTSAEVFAKRTDASPSANVYFGCAGFGEDNTRKAVNVVAVRSFWLDLDCGPSKPYATARDGVRALLAFVSTLGLPEPLVVLSGNGVHAYWVANADMPPETWRATAVLLKQACRIALLAADPSRTADVASVLRPVGTHHKKAEPKMVRSLMVPTTDIDRSEFHKLIEAYIEGAGEDPDLPEFTGDRSLNSDLIGDRPALPPSYADSIVEECAAMAHMRETRGNIPQPMWYRLLGVLAHTEDGAEKAQEWSSGHPAYSEDETARELARAGGFGPSTCAVIRGSCEVDFCAVCPHLGKVTSPILLGRQAPGPVPVHTTVIMPDGQTSSEQVTFPEGYEYRMPSIGFGSPQLCARVFDGDEEKWIAFSDCLFMPKVRIEDVLENYSLEIEQTVRGKDKRYFMLDCGLIGGGGSPLFTELAKHEIVSMPRQQAHLQNYLQSWVDKLRKEAEARKAFSHFGWHEGNFLIGDTLYTEEGHTKAMLTGNAARRAKVFQVAGSYDRWKEIIDAAYNHPGQEPFQFLVMQAFAAPLLDRFKEFGGVTTYAHSEGTGAGKTTAQRAALSAWGAWDRMQLTDGKTTGNAFFALLGTYNAIPVLYDELTNMANADAARLVFDVSSGRTKERLQSTGLMMDTNDNWCTIVMSSGNNLLSEKISLHRAYGEAEIARLFEFTIPRGISPLDPNEAAALFSQLGDHYGHAGREFMQYVVQHLPKVDDALRSVRYVFNRNANIQQGERYWSALHACVLTALKICRKLDIVQFDENALTAWIVEQLEVNRRNQKQAVADPTEQIGRLLSDMWQGILVTEGEGDLRTRAIAPIVGNQHPRGALVGRAIIPVATSTNGALNERAVLLLSQQAVRDWCNKKGVSAREMFTAGVAGKWIEPETRRYQLGKGTELYSHISGQVNCWVINLQRLGIDAGGGSVAKIAQLVGDSRVAGVVS